MQLLALALAFEEEEGVVEQPRRRLWVHDILRNRESQGAFGNLVQELRLDDARFKTFFRLNNSQFEDLLRRIGPAISKMQTKLRETISPDQRLCICLRWVTLTNVKERELVCVSVC